MEKQKRMKNIEYKPVIGLEIHVELKTKSKMFCGCDADYFGKKPNTHCCPVCLGLPGALPVPNKKAIEWTVMAGLALDCQIPLFSKFDRKNYFYPDLPKGYQISQYDQPFAVDGKLNIKYQISNIKNTYQKSKNVRNIRKDKKEIRIRRVHLEEDTGKLIHAVINGKKCTLIDFNRSGVSLMEIVTEPDIRSGEEAKIFLQKLQQLLRYLGVSDCDMEKGSMRCEPNISLLQVKPVKKKNRFNLLSSLPDYKVEIKNLNSFKFVKKAINYEIKRQAELLEAGKKIKQETRGWDENKQKTFLQRSKEKAADYRYFPEPDIPPIRWEKEEIEKLKKLLPELPDAKMERFIRKYGLSEYDVGILTATRETADYYERAMQIYQKSNIRNQNDADEKVGHARSKHRHKSKIKKFKRTIAQWIINKKIDINEVLPAELVKRIMKKYAPSTISKEELEKIIKQVLLNNKKAIIDYKKGKKQALMFLLGQVMGKTKGKADAKIVAKLLNAKIKNQNAK